MNLWAKRKLGSALLLLIIFVYNFIVGEDGKYRKHQQLSAINKFSVRNDSVSVIGEDVLDMVGHMIEADLQDNLLWQWSEVRTLIYKRLIKETKVLIKIKSVLLTNR